ncbi:MAG TPA: polysaccharide deacetylase family protein [Myxococcota bacterium]|nr:polysaccharide deacetylase family protein [Myxococcota bacterium]
MKVCVSVDLDNYQEYRRLVGSGAAEPERSFYDDALPRFLDAFDRHGLRATFFAIGRDAASPSHAKRLREAHARGHEIGNHSWSHPHNLRSFSRAAKEAEIAQGEEALADAVGVRPVGFRTPSVDVDAEVLEILASRGYLYDSSIIPSPLMWAFMLYGRLFVRESDYALGLLRTPLAPARPYWPATHAIHRRRSDAEIARGALLEIPVSVTPWLRLPYYGTLWRLLGPGAFAFALRGHAPARGAAHLMLHLLDLVDWHGTGLGDALERTPGVGVSFARRQRFVDGACEALVARGKPATLRDVALECRAASGLA